MLYRESREQSAELLRMALALMAKQQAGFHPPSYTLWYEHVAGLNPALSQTLGERESAGLALKDADVWQLYARYIVARDVEALDNVQQRLQSLLESTAQLVSEAGLETSQLRRTFEGHESRLREPVDIELLRNVAAELLSNTQSMCSMTATLSRELDSRAHEVQSLTAGLMQAQVEALLDPLTGLGNRRSFERALAELQATPSGLAGSALLFIDVDHFKSINDTHGHLLGDKVLRAIAQALRASIKGRDIAARFGGEEFAVFLPETSLVGAQALAERIRVEIAKGRIRRADRDEHIGGVTVSIGVTHAGPDDTLEAIIERGDAAMYAAKHAGRNRVSVATPDSPVSGIPERLRKDGS